MANSYKEIIITPNKSHATESPKIEFRGGNTTVNTAITIQSYHTSSGTLSFEGTAGQLFSVTNDLTGSIFSVNDVSGIPSIEVFASGQINLAQYGGNICTGSAASASAGTTIFGTPYLGVIHQNNLAATNGFGFTSYRRSGTEIGSVSQNGTTAVLYNTNSDRRLKENIAPSPSASDIIDAIEIVSHDWKSAPEEHVTYGVIAQDLALLAPQAVLQGDDGAEIEKTWGVDYSKLVPMLIKEVQSLRARVAQLEGN